MPDVIRLAVPDDARGITVVHVHGWLSAYRGIMPDEILDALDVESGTERRRGWIENPRDPENRFWVLDEDGEITGFATTGPTRDEDLDAESHELYAIYLKPDVIGTGRGRRLMDHVLQDLEARGFAELVLWVLVDNTSTQRFYEAAGFEQDARVAEKEQEGMGCMKRRLRRSLRPPA